MKFRALLLLALFLSHSWLSAGTALVTNSGSNNVTLIDTHSETIVNTISVGATPKAIAITPDGKKAVVCNLADNNATPILHLDTDPIAGTTIDVGRSPTAIAITPDGKKAFVCNSDIADTVTPILHVDTDAPITGTSIHVGSGLDAIAISPDGKKAFACSFNSNSVVPILHIDTDTPVKGASITVGSRPSAIAITPDAKKAFVCNGGSNTVTIIVDIDTDAPKLGATIAVGKGPKAIAITPNGKKAFVCNATDNTVTPIHDIDTDSPSTKTPITVGTFPSAIAITPDGKKAFVCNLSSNNVTPIIGIDTDSPSTETPIPVGIRPDAIAITPDQAPTAAFNATVASAGSPSIFDAIASSSPEGSIVKYKWDFGDGNKVTTDSAIISYTYKKSGTFTATLTVTNTAKTSTEKTFTGQTVSNNGGPSALTSKTMNIQLAPPKHFVGKEIFNKFLNETDRVLSMTWKASSSKGVAFYRIFKNDKVVAKISAKEPLTFTVCLNSSHNTKGYEIVAVTKDGIESTRVKLKVK